MIIHFFIKYILSHEKIHQHQESVFNWRLNDVSSTVGSDRKSAFIQNFILKLAGGYTHISFENTCKVGWISKPH